MPILQNPLPFIMNHSSLKTLRYCGSAANTAQPILREALILLFLLFTLFPVGAVKKFNANPINVAVAIVEKGDSANISKLFDYYGYTSQGKDGDYIIMRNANGDEMRYRYEGGKYPTLSIKAKGTSKEIEELLKELKFRKNGSTYERTINRYNNLVTKCKPAPNGHLVFKRD